MAKKKEVKVDEKTTLLPPEDKNAKTILDPNSGRQVINLKSTAIEPQVRDRVVALSNEIRQAMTDVRVGFLKIGKSLSEAEMILKPRKLWVSFLASFPNFKQAQAYRYINGYNIASQAYPPAVLEVILTTGMDMIGTKDRPFGKYQEIVKMLPPPKDADSGKAIAWCNQVEQRYAASRKKNNKTGPTPKELQKQAFGAVLRCYAKVPDKQQLQWIRGLFGYVLGNLGMVQTEEIIPQTPPNEFIKKVGEAKEATDEQE